MELVHSASHRSRNLIGQWRRKPSGCCQKDVKKLSQTNQKLCPTGNGSMRSTVKVKKLFGLEMFYGAKDSGKVLLTW